MLIVPDADAGLAWYETALGATQLWNLGGVAGLAIGGAPVFLHEVNPDNPTETLYSPEPKAPANALALVGAFPVGTAGFEPATPRL